ncbi:VCBS repeat-containing protein [Seonamhaeicola sp.]|uniref:FG-GAP repeat domain-containing protein n=1 Tax=Seonamhaeicola sp. TaxID=1912245 RepID=UPI0026380433|nr:VCBS repeat-containing protein [Seonamhaeicola sp.]
MKTGKVFVLIILLCFNCKSDKKALKSTEIDSTNIIDGEALAQMHCARCHEFPEPQVMPKRYWQEVLPIMGLHLGQVPEGKTLDDFKNKVAKERLTASGLFPSESLVSNKEWEAIVQYYDNNSPENLPDSEKPMFIPELGLFEHEVFPWKASGDGLTFLNFREDQFLVGYNKEDGASFYSKMDASGNELESYSIKSPLVQVKHSGATELLLSMGRMFNIDEPTGSLSVLIDKPNTFINNLERPVDFIVDDLDKDGAMDIMISEFGKYLGGINIYTNKGKIDKTTIHAKSGAINFVLKDVNKDGLKDFYVLISQEDESVYLFLNKGGLKFEKQQLISLPPYYGTTHFELMDFDGDGDDDIICSSGDSDDFISALKPYHGIRIFENKGNHSFEQVWFHKQEGAYGTACADYDGDGDIDIASIGYYASLENKDNEVFLYFENVSSQEQPWQFKAFSPLKTLNNCFMLVRARDIDADGDMDILLGSNLSIFSGERKTLISEQWMEQGGAISILRNTTN